MLLRETFAAGPLSCNCSVLGCPTTKDAVVIDPGGETERIADIVRSNGLTVVAIIHTHAHLDHIFCTREVKLEHGGDICLHKADTFLYDGIRVQAQMFGWSVDDPLPIERFVEHGDEIVFGEQRASVVHTPGHTPGSVCFEIDNGDEKLVFAGDTLFRRGIGRTDLPGGDSKQIVESIRNRLYTMRPDALVVPGHGPETTIAEEATKNPFVTAK